MVERLLSVFCATNQCRSIFGNILLAILHKSFRKFSEKIKCFAYIFYVCKVNIHIIFALILVTEA